MSFLWNTKNLVLTTKAGLPKNILFLTKHITTSPKSSEVSAVSANIMEKTRVKRQKKNWVTYGFDEVDQRKDKMLLHSTSFFQITIFFWGVIFLMFYYPDLDDTDWMYREAYLELRRREVLGLPLIDKNYARPEDIPLPPDEELGEDEIII